jgi:hypothetical protein
VFRSAKSGQLGCPLVHRIPKAADARAGLPGEVSMHWLRHAHVSHALDRGEPEHSMQAADVPPPACAKSPGTAAWRSYRVYAGAWLLASSDGQLALLETKMMKVNLESLGKMHHTARHLWCSKGAQCRQTNDWK